MVIMIVDDEPDICSTFKLILEHRYPSREILTAKNGVDCLETLSRIKFLDPSVVITDLQMPVMNGIELRKEIKKKYPGLKMILLTACSRIDAEGFDRVLLKPVNINDLFKCIENIYC